MRYFILICLSIMCANIFGQLVVTQQSAANLVQNTLLGTGVTVSNISFTGTAAQIGRFSGSTNLGIASGVVITTGTVLNTGNGPQGPNNSPSSGQTLNRPGYAPLTALLGGSATTFDAAILEFDFIPLSDSVKFRYVFASEEYPEYVGTQFNDVFAFFISGPGFAGVQNLAKLPSGQTVTINNVNNGNPTTGSPAVNPAFYVDNSGGISVQYDGFTRVLTAKAKVICGQTYRLKISIADVGDGAYDSGIFLEANSLTSPVVVDVSTSISNIAFANPNEMAEGCTNGQVVVSRFGANVATTSLTIPITVSGTATQLADYTAIPTSITFNPGVSTQTINFSTLTDALAEGTESIIFEFGIPDPCDNTVNLTRTLFIRDLAPLVLNLEDFSVICAGELVDITAEVSGGGGTYTYLWSPGNETTPSISVTTTVSSVFTVTVTEGCSNQTISGSSIVSVPTYLPLVVTATNDITEICPYVPNVLTAEVTGGAGSYDYQWFTSVNQLGTTAIQNVAPAVTTNYTVEVTDFCGEVTTENVLVTITSPPLLLQMTPNIEICPFDSVQIGVIASGGFGNYYYNWSHDGSTTSSIVVRPSQTTTYTVNVSDDCQTFTVQGQTTIVVIKPTADFNYSGNVLFEDLLISLTNTSINATSYIWDFGNSSGSTQPFPNTIYDVPGTYLITLIAIDDKGCKDTISRPIVITPEWYFYVPNTFTPDDGRVNKFFAASTINIKELQVTIFNRWGELIFESDDPKFNWDGTYKGILVPDGVYICKINYTNILDEQRLFVGHVNVIK